LGRIFACFGNRLFYPRTINAIFNSMKSIKVAKLNPALRLLDLLKVPFKLLLNGFKFDAINETGLWHVQTINSDDVDTKKAFLIEGNDTSWVKDNKYLFHQMTLFGGWKNYTALEAETDNFPFNIGWVIYDKNSNKLKRAEVQRLPISDKRIRVLNGTPNFKVYFFALDKDGNQVPIKKVGEGKLGDNNFKDLRLF